MLYCQPSRRRQEDAVYHRPALAAVAALFAALAVGACAELQEAARSGQAVATQAAEAAPTLQALAQTAQAAAPTIQAQAGELRQTVDAIAPTIQAAAPTLRAVLPTFEALLPTLQASGIQQTAEAFATALPALEGAERATAEAFATQGVGGAPADIPLAPRSQTIYTSATRLVYTTELAPAAVRELYEVDMPAAGWTPVPGAVEQGQATRLQFERPGRRAVVTIAPLNTGAGVEVSVEQR
jgi:hypothetical protein